MAQWKADTPMAISPINLFAIRALPYRRSELCLIGNQRFQSLEESEIIEAGRVKESGPTDFIDVA